MTLWLILNGRVVLATAPGVVASEATWHCSESDSERTPGPPPESVAKAKRTAKEAR